MLITYPQYPGFEALPIRQLAARTNGLLSDQELRIAKHWWGDSENLFPINPADYTKNDHHEWYPVAVYPGAPNKSLEELVVLYRIRLQEENDLFRLSFEVSFSLHFRPEEKNLHADYFENIIRQLQQSNYPLKRQYSFAQEGSWRNTITEVGSYEKKETTRQAEELAAVIRNVYADVNKIFS